MKKVAVLLSTYNGEKFIKELIHSVLNQKGVDIYFLIRDDGSEDGTKDILENLKGMENVSILYGENKGVIDSFFELIKLAGTLDCDYYALCDQDDYWHEDKLYSAVMQMQAYENTPALYYSEVSYIDEKSNAIIKEKYKSTVSSFYELLFRNNAVGCTMVFNRKLETFIGSYIPHRVIMHDHWIYLVCCSLDGKIIFDQKSHIDYRLHENNVVGSPRNILYRTIHNGLFEHRGIRREIAEELLEGFGEEIGFEKYRVLECIKLYKKSFRNKFRFLCDRNFYFGGLKNLYFILVVLLESY